MARLALSGFEMNDGNVITSGAFDGSATFAASPIGTGSIQTGTVRTGTYAAKLSSGASNGPAGLDAIGPVNANQTVVATASATSFCRCYMNFDALPAGTIRVMWFGAASVGGAEPQDSVSVRLTAGGKMQLFNGNTNTQVGSDSAATISAGTWYRVELSMTLDGSTNTTACELQLDGVSVASTSGLSFSALGKTSVVVGLLDAPGANKNVYLDDFALNDSTGAGQTSWPGAGAVVLLVPTGDSAKGTGWTNDAAGTTNLFDAVNNLPPVGIADTTVSTGLHQIRNATSNANSSYDATMTTYTAAGVGAGATVNVVVPLVFTASVVSTSAKQGTVGVVSNPAITNVALGLAGASGAFWGGAAAGTYLTGWKWPNVGTITYAPTVTLGTAPVMRITQVTSSTRIAMVCFMGIYVDYTPAAAPSTAAIRAGVVKQPYIPTGRY